LPAVALLQPDESAFSSEIQFNFIHVTPAPIFPRLKRFYDRVLRFMKMFCGVLVLGAVAAAHMATLQAQSQVHPGVAHFQTLLAPLRGLWLYRPYLVQMSTFRHLFSPC
jgi:hypothetical protein